MHVQKPGNDSYSFFPFKKCSCMFWFMILKHVSLNKSNQSFVCVPTPYWCLWSFPLYLDYSRFKSVHLVSWIQNYNGKQLSVVSCVLFLVLFLICGGSYYFFFLISISEALFSILCISWNLTSSNLFFN